MKVMQLAFALIILLGNSANVSAEDDTWYCYGVVVAYKGDSLLYSPLIRYKEITHLTPSSAGLELDWRNHLKANIKKSYSYEQVALHYCTNESSEKSQKRRKAKAELIEWQGRYSSISKVRGFNYSVE